MLQVDTIAQSDNPADQAVPAVGVSLKSDYYQTVIEQMPAVDFFEIHAENYMMPAGPHWRALAAIQDKGYNISLHGVGLSLGSAEGVDKLHLKRYQALIDRLNPLLVSDHLSWSVNGGIYMNDLLPLPFTHESLSLVARNIKTVQDSLGRQLLIENPSSYLSFTDCDFSEVDFLNQLVQQTGCGLLLDVNNVYVSSKNVGLDAEAYVRDVDASAVGEIHLAGHTARDIDGKSLLIDDHGSAVSAPVFDLFATAIKQGISAPVLIERDSNLPDLKELVNEAHTARKIADEAHS